MDKDEMKNKISMALKDPILQQGFEIICKDLAISEHDREHNDYELTEVYKKVAELEEKLANADYQLEGRDLEIKELKAQIEKMRCCGNCRFSESDTLNGTFCHREGCFVVASAKCKLWEN
jgi:hypothetical protein